MQLHILGVYGVPEADEPCHLVEIACSGVEEPLDVGAFTQADPDLPPSDWQAPYDEHFLDGRGLRLLDPDAPEEQPEHDRFRLVFFFHRLDPGRPLESPAGPLHLPAPSPLPDRLAFVRYEAP